MAQDLSKSACVSCYRRKVRCDRLVHGCSSCQKISIPCRYSPKTSSANLVRDGTTYHNPKRKKPRGPYKKGKTVREKELEDLGEAMSRRCRELEKIIEDRAIANFHGRNRSSHDSDSPGISPTPDYGLDHDTPASAADFSLDEESEHHGSLESYSGGTPSHLADRNTVTTKLFQNSSQAHHSSCQVLELWHIYMTRVDPILKLVHNPSFSKKILQVAYSPNTVEPSLHTLIFSICFASINALSNNEVMERFNENKEILLARYMHDMQTSPAYLDAVHQPRLTILQALVLHAVCLQRRNESNQSLFWKTFNLALQVARLMGIDKGGIAVHSPLEVEIERRCWWTLFKMRGHYQGSSATDVEAEFSSYVSLPLAVNDIDLCPDMDDRPNPRAGITDISCLLFTLELTRLDARAQILSSYSGHARLKHIERKKLEEDVKRLENNFIKHCDPSRPFDWFLLLTAKVMLNAIEIIMLEDMEPSRDGFKAPAGIIYKSKDDARFSLHLDILECLHILKTNNKLKLWSWYYWNVQPTVTVEDICRELATRPPSSLSDRAHALIELITLG